jgi:hypothetical protein
MAPDRTELEWKYQPTDFFEAAYRHADSDHTLVIEGGQAVATLSIPQDPVNEVVETRIATHLESIFLVRQLQLHRVSELERRPRVVQHVGGRTNRTLRVDSIPVVLSGGQADTITQDAAGNIIQDSKAERIAGHNTLLDTIAPKASASPVLRGLLTTYSRAIYDPSNELVYLYEIRDALAAHYGSDAKAARAALKISKAEWRRLGELANAEPLDQGRHRGEHVGRRNATAAELNEARGIVLGWIIAFAGTI